MGQHAAADRYRLAGAVGVLLLGVVMTSLFVSPPGQSQTHTAASLFQGADLALGERLLTEHKCAACHSRRVGGVGSAIYRPQGRINTPGFLRGMVEQCNMELKLSLFPEEVGTTPSSSNSIATCVHTARHRVATRSLCSL